MYNIQVHEEEEEEEERRTRGESRNGFSTSEKLRTHHTQKQQTTLSFYHAFAVRTRDDSMLLHCF